MFRTPASINGWKLAFVAFGAPPVILDSSAEARLPVITEILTLTIVLYEKTVAVNEAGKDAANQGTWKTLGMLHVNARGGTVVLADDGAAAGRRRVHRRRKRRGARWTRPPSGALPAATRALWACCAHGIRVRWDAESRGAVTRAGPRHGCTAPCVWCVSGRACGRHEYRVQGRLGEDERRDSPVADVVSATEGIEWQAGLSSNTIFFPPCLYFSSNTAAETLHHLPPGHVLYY
ncbi:hypothetical protein DFH07DRAFT_534415 [Mycena maculata]|uniref:Uncharacterized protein n=1 Tax=Mycena maculata TaxID=230809 RepID=A0AAD7K561_9AGAR|nr:hypothetical protein DFH07DRAFT_534415 [Mycena maculata]